MCCLDKDDESLICRVKVVKEGLDFVAIVELSGGSIKTYRHRVPEELFTEMAISLQEELEDD